jgi:hypothetical protein
MQKKRGRKPRVNNVTDALVEVRNEIVNELEETTQEIVETASKGLGDTLEKVFKKTGIDKVVKFIAGEDCGCDERKDKLNKLFPYRKITCLTEDEYTVLDTFFNRNTAEISPSDQYALLKVYNRVLNVRQEPTSCSSCWRDIVNQLRSIYNQY